MRHTREIDSSSYRATARGRRECLLYTLKLFRLTKGTFIEVRWLDNAVERAPGLFATDQAAKDCLSPDSLARWLEERSKAQ